MAILSFTNFIQELTSLGEARNLAIKQSNGELVAFLDCDDVWFKDKLFKQIPLFRSPNVGIVICDTYFFNEKRILKQIYKKTPPPIGDVFRDLLGKYFISLESFIDEFTTIFSRQLENK